MEKMKSNCIIIHGCPSDAEKAMNPETRTYDKHWIPWLKKTKSYCIGDGNGNATYARPVGAKLSKIQDRI